jgi:receptor protein-tyrosine kinase
MSSLIEQAVKRLEELRRAGVDIPPINGFASSRFDDQDAFADTEPLEPPRRVAAAADAGSLESAGQQPEAPVAAAAANGAHHERSETTALAPVTAVVPSAPSPRRRVEIDLARLAGMGYLVPAQAQSLLADLLRVIKRPLLQNKDRPPELGGPARRGNIILVTSALPGEGKTFVALNLAMSVAMEIDHAAMLIDGDVLRPSIFARLNLEPQTGLMDALVDAKVRVTDLLVGSNVPKLTLLAAGTAQDRAEELLASAAMDSLLDELSERFHDRVIIIDSPPLLMTTESRALAERAGQVVLVVEADRTPREQVARAMETLSNCPIVLSVLNKSRAIESDYVYGY